MILLFTLTHEGKDSSCQKKNEKDHDDRDCASAETTLGCTLGSLKQLLSLNTIQHLFLLCRHGRQGTLNTSIGRSIKIVKLIDSALLHILNIFTREVLDQIIRTDHVMTIVDLDLAAHRLNVVTILSVLITNVFGIVGQETRDDLVLLDLVTKLRGLVGTVEDRLDCGVEISQKGLRRIVLDGTKKGTDDLADAEISSIDTLEILVQGRGELIGDLVKVTFGFILTLGDILDFFILILGFDDLSS